MLVSDLRICSFLDLLFLPAALIKKVNFSSLCIFQFSWFGLLRNLRKIKLENIEVHPLMLDFQFITHNLSRGC